MVTKLFLGEEGEDTLGNAVGQAVAMIGGQAILDFFTGGLFEAVPILEEILEAPAEMMEEVFGLLKELGSYVVEGVKDLGSMVSEAGGPLGEMMGSLTEIGEDLIKFGEELLADLGIVSEEAAAGEAAVAEAGSAVSAAETGAAEASAAEKAAAEATSAEEAAAAEEKAEQETQEAEKQAENETEEKAEQEELEHEEAAAAAHLLAGEEEEAHIPAGAATLALDELKAKFEWIDHFEARPAGAAFDLVMIGSEELVYGGYVFTMADEPEGEKLSAEEKPTESEEAVGAEGGEEEPSLFDQGLEGQPQAANPEDLGEGVTPSAMQEKNIASTQATELGQAGQLGVPYEQNTSTIPSLSGTANYRRPDILEPGLIGEVKNRINLSADEVLQIKDSVAWAEQEGLVMELWVKGPGAPGGATILGPEIQALVDDGSIVLKEIMGLE